MKVSARPRASACKPLQRPLFCSLAHARAGVCIIDYLYARIIMFPQAEIVRGRVYGLRVTSRRNPLARVEWLPFDRANNVLMRAFAFSAAKTFTSAPSLCTEFHHRPLTSRRYTIFWQNKERTRTYRTVRVLDSRIHSRNYRTIEINFPTSRGGS